jgi:calmodulin
MPTSGRRTSVSARGRSQQKLTDVQQQEVDEAFRLMLRDDGQDAIDAASLRRILCLLGHDGELIEAVPANGKISRDEFVEKLCLKSKNAMSTSEKQLEEAFRVFDKDGNKDVDAGELRDVLKNLGFDLSEEETDEMLILADEDGNRSMNYDEFVETLKKHHSELSKEKPSECAELTVIARFWMYLCRCHGGGDGSDGDECKGGVGGGLDSQPRWWPFWSTLGDPIDFLEVAYTPTTSHVAPSIYIPSTS